MIDNAYFLVEKETALRTGLVSVRYRTKDGKYVMDSRDLSHIRPTSSEIINGIQGVKQVTYNEAQTLIASGGFKMGFEDMEEK